MDGLLVAGHRYFKGILGRPQPGYLAEEPKWTSCRSFSRVRVEVGIACNVFSLAFSYGVVGPKQGIQPEYDALNRRKHHTHDNPVILLDAQYGADTCGSTMPVRTALA